MKKKFFLTISVLILATLLAACGFNVAATPTINPDDVNNTAVAAAFTVIAQTHEALPTETAAPPTAVSTNTPVITETSSPTNTPVSSDTPASLFTDTPESTFTATFAPTATAANDAACNNVLGASAAKKYIRLKLLNKTQFPVSITIYLNKTAFGDCGYRAYSLPKGAQTLISDLPFGCYNATAFIRDPKGARSAFGYGCANNTDVWTFAILNDSLIFTGP